MYFNLEKIYILFVCCCIACSKDEIDDLNSIQGIGCKRYLYELCYTSTYDIFQEIYLKRIGQMSFLNKNFKMFLLWEVYAFPENIDEGDAFNLIDDNKENLSAVLAYSPVPQKEFLLQYRKLI